MADEPHSPKSNTPRDVLDWLGIKEAPDWARSRLLGGLFGFLLLVVVALAVVATFATLISTILLATKGGEGPNLGAGALVAAVLGAPFVIWGTVIRHRALGFQKEGHITDRISKAVEQLGAEKTVKVRGKDSDGKNATIEETKPNIEVRIGAILSLERIAQDSTAYDKGRDHVRVMEILCAYIRENSNARPVQEHPYVEWKPLKDDATEAKRSAHLEKRHARFGEGDIDAGQVRSWANTLRRTTLREDVAIAILVVSRRAPSQRLVEAQHGPDAAPGAEWVFGMAAPTPPEPDDDDSIPAGAVARFKAELEAWRGKLRAYTGYRPDLRKANLQGADLPDIDLRGMDLRGARLEGANLSWARLEGANLSLARLEGANLSWARLEGADLSLARLEGANLSEARLEGANLSLARLERAILFRARLEGADLDWARLEGANLWEARLEGANLSWARLEGAILFGARLDDRTRLTDVSLRGASVRRVDWQNVSLSPDQILSMFGDGSVTLPGGVKPGEQGWPEHWPVRELGLVEFEKEWRKWQADPEGYEPPPPPVEAEDGE